MFDCLSDLNSGSIFLPPYPPRFVAYVKDKEGCPTKEVEILTPREDERGQEEWVATLAHEAGHIEQGRDIRGRKPMLPPTELDAQIRGLKWAIRWGVLPEYVVSFRLPSREDAQRIIAQIKNLAR